MQWSDLWAAFALYLVLEGLLPFASPRRWREALVAIAELLLEKEVLFEEEFMALVEPAPELEPGLEGVVVDDFRAARERPQLGRCVPFEGRGRAGGGGGAGLGCRG